MSILIKTFGHQKRWVNWVPKLHEGKMTKVPLGKANDPKTWSIYEELPNKEHVGLMFGTQKMLLGIDIDKCITDGKISNKLQSFIDQVDSYCEISPSGTGLHLFLNLTEPLALKANRHGSFECYTSERYFTVTNNSFGEVKPVRKVTPAEAEALLTSIGYPWKKESTAQIPRTSIAITLEDQEVLKKMFSSRIGERTKALYGGDTSPYGNDDSIADLSLCGTLAFYTGGNADQMERLWLSSPLGNRAKTQERKDYRDRTIAEAIRGCKEFYKPRIKKVTKILTDDGQEQEFDEESMGLHYSLSKDGKKTYLLIQENINILLEKHPHFAGRFRYDEFMLCYQIRFGEEWRSQTDTDEMFIQSEISNIFPSFNRVSPTMVQRAIMKVAKEHTRDCAKEYIASLVWDKVPRIDNWLQNVFGVEDGEYTQKVGSNWLKGLVDRLMRPGCQFDYVLVVEGAQGLKKSSAFRELVTDSWHLETEQSPGEKDFFVEMAGKAIVELSEGQSNAMIDVKKMKSILTKRKDTYRSPYGRIAEDHPRRSVFCMTTNDDDYLKDTTGDRRWWPVACTRMADVEWIKQNRDQLFAEARDRLLLLKETTYEVPEKIAQEMQEERRRKEPNVDLVIDWYENRCLLSEKMKGITVYDVFIGAFHSRSSSPVNVSMKRNEEMEIAAILKNTLHLKKKRVTQEGLKRYRYYDESITVTEAQESPVEFYKDIEEIQ